jgi:hypothetical protein
MAKRKTADVPSNVLEAIRRTDGDWYALTMYSAKPEEEVEDSGPPTRCRIEVYAPTGRWWAPYKLDMGKHEINWSTLVMNLPPQVEDIVGKTTSVMRAHWRILAMTCIDATHNEQVELHEDLIQALRGQAGNIQDIATVAATADSAEHERAYAWHVICKWLGGLNAAHSGGNG